MLNWKSSSCIWYSGQIAKNYPDYGTVGITIQSIAPRTIL